jgi:hypothetical protein
VGFWKATTPEEIVAAVLSIPAKSNEQDKAMGLSPAFVRQSVRRRIVPTESIVPRKPRGGGS